MQFCTELSWKYRLGCGPAERGPGSYTTWYTGPEFHKVTSSSPSKVICSLKLKLPKITEFWYEDMQKIKFHFNDIHLILV